MPTHKDLFFKGERSVFDGDGPKGSSSRSPSVSGDLRRWPPGRPNRPKGPTNPDGFYWRMRTLGISIQA